MAKGDVETYHQDGSWKNRTEGGQQLTGEYDKKEDAVAAGRKEAQSRKTEHVIKNLDGKIGEKNSYGNDPRNIPG
jgi:hypothetical protein